MSATIDDKKLLAKSSIDLIKFTNISQKAKLER